MTRHALTEAARRFDAKANRQASTLMELYGWIGAVAHTRERIAKHAGTDDVRALFWSAVDAHLARRGKGKP